MNSLICLRYRSNWESIEVRVAVARTALVIVEIVVLATFVGDVIRRVL